MRCVYIQLCNGFLYIWNDPHCLDNKVFLSLFKQRLLDDFIQNWKADLNVNRVLFLYKEVKPEFGYADYLNIFCTRRLRNVCEIASVVSYFKN